MSGATEPLPGLAALGAHAGHGLLRHGGIFQLGYVTGNLDAAMDRGRAMGIGRFRVVDVGSATGRDFPYGARIAMAWAGGLMIELIQPLDGVAPVYVEDLARAGDGIVFNHVGIAVPDGPSWTALIADLESRDLAIPWRGSDPERFDVAYVDTRALLGHYCEYIHTTPDMIALFKAVP